MPTYIHFRLAALSAALAACYPLTAHSAAGTLQFVIGDVSIRRGGTTIAGTKGGNVESGDSLATGPTGRAQIKFSDGGFIALQPNTKFEVTRYADTGDTRQDKFLVKLAKGGLRAITGAIGHRNHDNYTVETPTALIGIRGSSFTAFYDPNDRTLRVANEQDSIQVCTSGGCVGLTAGETALVSPNSTNQQPARTNYRPTLPVPVPVQAPQVVSNQSTPAGTPEVVVQAVFAPQSEQPPGVQVAAGTHPGETVPVPAPPAPVPAPPAPTPPAPVPVPPAPVPTPPPAPVPPSVSFPPSPPAPVPAPTAGPSPGPSPSPSPSPPSFSGLSFTTRSVSALADSQTNANGGATYDTNLHPTQFNGASAPVTNAESPPSGPTYVDNSPGSTAYMAVGSWQRYRVGTGQTLYQTPASQPLVYAVGTQAPVTTVAGLSGLRGYYSLTSGANTPVYSNSTQSSGNGTITSASLVVDFLSGANSAQVYVDVDMPAPTSGSLVTGTTTYNLLGTVTGSAGNFSGKVANNSTACNTGQTTCGIATVDAFLSGGAAQNAGLSFVANSAAHGDFSGAAALSRGSPAAAVPTPSPHAGNQVAFLIEGSANLSPFTVYDAAATPSTSFSFAGSKLTSSADATTTRSLGTAPGVSSSYGAIDIPTNTRFVGWGYWGQETVSAGPSPLYDTHYVVGQPNTTSLPISGRASYALVGGTTPTRTVTSPAPTPTTTFGTLDDATLDVNFWQSKVQAQVKVTFGGVQSTIGNTATLANGQFQTLGTNGDQIAGFLASGSNLQFAGLNYVNTVGNTRIAGTAALQSTSFPNIASLNSLASSYAIGSTTGTFFVDGRVAGQNGSNNYYLRQTGTTLLEKVDLNSPLVGTSYPGNATTPFPTTTASFTGTLAVGDFLGWGYWSDGNNLYSSANSDLKDVHYVVGTPTANINTATGTVVYGTVDGHTTPTFTSAAGVTTPATLQSASLTANFSAAPSATLNASVTVGSVDGSGTAIINMNNVAVNSNATFSGTAPTPGPLPRTDTIAGVFVGALAPRPSASPGPTPIGPAGVGLTFSQSNPTGTGGKVAGAVVLKP